MNSNELNSQIESKLNSTSIEANLRLAHYGVGGKLIPHTKQVTKLSSASLEAKQAQIKKQLSSKLNWSKENRLYFELKLVENELNLRRNEGNSSSNWLEDNINLDLSLFEGDDEN
jgi:hypothetical protein